MKNVKNIGLLVFLVCCFSTTLFSDSELPQDFQKLLDKIAGDVSLEQIKKSKSVSKNSTIPYVRCTWWGGCYYCQDNFGNWYLVYCVGDTSAKNPTEAPNVMQKILDSAIGKMTTPMIYELKSLKLEKKGKHHQCVWWAGCYYCRNELGKWELIYCLGENDNDDLQIFFSKDDEAYTTKISEKEVDVLKDVTSNKSSLSSCAKISYRGSCGFTKSGRLAYVNNMRRDKRVRATVRVRWSRGIRSGEYDKTYTIAAGSKRLLGCTRSNDIPVTSYVFTVVGCEVLK